MTSRKPRSEIKVKRKSEQEIRVRKEGGISDLGIQNS